MKPHIPVDEKLLADVSDMEPESCCDAAEMRAGTSWADEVMVLFDADGVDIDAEAVADRPIIPSGRADIVDDMGAELLEYVRVCELVLAEV